jgi:hypothetical protein
MALMNWTKACNILELPIDCHVSDELIKTHYKRLALKWHPDKCKDPNATAMYCEIKAARDFLLENPDKRAKTHVSTAMMFFETLYNNKEFQRNVLKPLLNRVVAMCETKAGEFIDGLEETQAKAILSLLKQNKDVLNLSDDFFTKRTLSSATQHIVLNPCLNDLLELNVYKMKRDDFDSYVYVPLWAPTNIFDGGLVIHCLPDLPEHVWIDENNGLHVEQQCILKDLWKNGGFYVDLPEKQIFIERTQLFIKEEQIVCLFGKGLPSLKNSNHCLDVEKRAPLYVHLEIVDHI